MSKNEKPKKPKLNIQEISESKKLLREIMEQKRDGKIDIRSTFELMYLNFLPLLDNREYVKDELKELKSMLDSSAGLMLAIIEKSKRTPVK
jgi:hypothetical protein